MKYPNKNQWSRMTPPPVNCSVDDVPRPQRKRRVSRMYVLEHRFPKHISELVVTEVNWALGLPRIPTCPKGGQDKAMARLEKAANNGNESDFLKALNEIHWQGRPVSDFVRSIKLAFRAGAFAAARHIVAEATKYHAGDAEIQRYAKVLTPVRRVATTTETPVSTRANRSWLERHAGVYRGQWIALRNGELLGVSDSLNSLVEEVSKRYGVSFPSKEIMVTTGY